MALILENLCFWRWLSRILMITKKAAVIQLNGSRPRHVDGGVISISGGKRCKKQAYMKLCCPQNAAERGNNR